MKHLARWALPILAVVAASGVSSRGITPALATGTAATRTTVCVYDHLTLRTDPRICRPRARSYPPSVRGKVKRAIYDSALTVGVPYKTLLAIARCESGLNPQASNGSYFGLYQFAPETFRRASAQMAQYTGIQPRSYWNALDSAYAAGFLFVIGQARSWSCVTAIR